MKNSIRKNLLSLAVISGLSIMTMQTTFARPQGVEGQVGPEQQGQRQDGQVGEVVAADVLSRMDYDGDGMVTVDDFISQAVARSTNHFDRMDSDVDGYLTIEEISVNGKSRQGLDDNLDLNALTQCIEQTTGVTLEQKVTAAEAFDIMDIDGDSVVSIEEFQTEKVAHAQIKFDQIDTDADTVISEDEVTVHMQQRQLIRSAQQSCKNEQVLSEII